MKNFDWAHAIETTPEAFHERVQRTLDALPQEKTMKNQKIKRTVLIAVAAVMLLTVGAFAAGGNIAIITGSSSPANELGSFRAVTMQLEKGIKGLPEGVSVPESFSNGFAFRSGSVSHNKGYDEDGAKVRDYKSLDLRYRKGNASVYLAIDPDLDIVPEGESVSLAGTEVYLTDVIQKVVNEDYVLSPEEQAAEAAGTMFFTYTDGLEAPEEIALRMATWLQDGAMYQLFSQDGLTELADLTAMAEELITK